MNSQSTLQRLCIFFGVVLLIITAGFVFQAPWITILWPWPDTHLSYIFIGSIVAAIAAAVLWIGRSAEWGAAAAGAVNVMITAGGMSVYLFQRVIQDQSSNLMGAAIGTALACLFSLRLLRWSRKYSLKDNRPTPLLVRISFGVFVFALLSAGTALLLRAPTVFPWPLNPDSSVLFGWIFIGDAFYFLYGLVYPRWHNARGQLWSFLAYDLVLLPPLLALTTSVKPEHTLSLVVYLSVLVYSTLLAIYYLFLNPATRNTSQEKSGGEIFST